MLTKFISRSWANFKHTSVIAAIALAFVTLPAFSQTIKGVIVSEAGSLPGANINGKTFKRAASSDLQGVFTILAPDTGLVTIEISYIGYASKSIAIKLNKGINDLGLITMSPDTKRSLGDVVIRGTMAPSQAKAYSIKIQMQ